jgi:rubredoxin
MKMICEICGWIYDPEVGDPDNGVAAGTKWEDVPEDYLCPECAAPKSAFVEN